MLKEWMVSLNHMSLICYLAYRSVLLLQVSEEEISAGISALDSGEPISHSPSAFVGWPSSGPFVVLVIGISRRRGPLSVWLVCQSLCVVSGVVL